MKLTELETLVESGATTAILLAALDQKTVQVDGGWNPADATDAGICACGLLLARLPATLTFTRVVPVRGTARRVHYAMTHAHAAMPYNGQFLPVCRECWDAEDGPCEEHLGTVCDAPTPELCAQCGDSPALPGGADPDHCRACQPREQEWDKDHYLDLMGYH